MINLSFDRFFGRAYPSRDIVERQAIYGRHGAHIEAKWTTPEHFAHNNYEIGHLPQICVIASGWKARLIALILWPEKPWTPDREVI